MSPLLKSAVRRLWRSHKPPHIWGTLRRPITLIIIIKKGVRNIVQNTKERSYNWASILYTESCIGDIEGALLALKVPCALSPLHDRDVNDDSGEVKKPHYHLLLHYTSLKSRRQVNEDLEPLGAVGAERVRELGAYARYLIHADDPAKAQYDIQDLRVFNGFNIIKYLEDAPISSDAGFAALIKIALDNNYTEYCDLVTYCLNCDAELLPSCRKSAYALTSFLKSRAFQTRKNKKTE